MGEAICEGALREGAKGIKGGWGKCDGRGCM